MQAILNGEAVPLEEVTLDSFGWDSSESVGTETLVLCLSSDDLRAVGQVLWEYAEECIADEPDYFEGEFREDIPVPESDALFIDDPMLLGLYLEDSFWNRETITAILNLDPLTGAAAKPTFQIENFQRVDPDGMGVLISFGVHRTP